MSPTLSIVIINTNAWEDLRKCLAALRASEDASFEVVVIDNASTDESVENVRSHFPKVRVQENETNLGHPQAVNQGFTLANGEYVLLLDADTEMERESIELLVRFMEERS